MARMRALCSVPHRQGGRYRCRPFDGRARRGYDHRSRGLPHDHDLAATACHGRDPDRGFVIGIWAATAVLLAAAVMIGNGALKGVSEAMGVISEELVAVMLSFAGGAVLASLANTLMPDAYREGGRLVAFATAAGFLLSFLISQ